MSRRRKFTDSTPFDTLRLEGTLFVPELLERAARGEAAHQKEADYGVPKGLKLHDEYGRAYRIAAALWHDFAPQLPRNDLDNTRLTRTFVTDLLRDCLGFTDLALCPAPLDANGQSRTANSADSHSPLATHHSPAIRSFPITALAIGGTLPVIIAPHHLGLDDPDPTFAILGSGARRKSAHQLAQEFLNAQRHSLWAIVTNGRRLRLLRHAESLTRPNFLEFDLETILREGEDRYADFSALWRILHASRAGQPPHSPFPIPHSPPPSPHSPLTIPHSPPNACVWEQWKSEGHAQGLRVRDGLRSGVTEALLILGKGFLTHPDNISLRQQLHDGTLTKENYFQQLLRLIYRSLFLFCAEERDLLHPPDPPASEPRTTNTDPNHSPFTTHHSPRLLYASGYSLRRLRSRSLRQKAHDPHTDLWLGQTIVFRALASGQPRLALPALGGLFAPSQCPDLDSSALTNRDFLAAIRHLRWSSASGTLTAIDYRNMGPEELGSVYESLLELVPQLDLPARSFGFAGITDSTSTSGNARKTSGSYYTPDSLVQELIKSSLDPVIADRLAEAGRMANSEWPTLEPRWREIFTTHHSPPNDQRLQGSGSLEKGPVSGTGSLSADKELPEGGTLRHDLPDPSGRHLHSGQHRGGMGTPLPSGIHPVSQDSQWQPQGTGNPPDHLHGCPPLHGSGQSTPPHGMHHPGETNPRPPAQSGEAANGESRITEAANGESRIVNGVTEASQITTHHSPFTIRHSPDLSSLWEKTPLTIRHSLFATHALLSLSVCDPSCGSGHFLLAAARRLAEKLAEIKAPDGAVRPDDYRHALREVASRCLYGVDINPMAVELCRVALWLETVDPGKPLGFLNHHIRSGNSLLGTTPDLIAAGLPDETFTAIEGDDKTACAELKKRNKKEREGFGPLFEKEEQAIRDRLRLAATQLEAMDDSQPAALQQKEAAFSTSESTPEFRHAKLLADLWCAAFVFRKRMVTDERMAQEQKRVGNSESRMEQSVTDVPPEGSEQLDMFADLPSKSAKATRRTKKPLTIRNSPFTPVGITTGTLRNFVQGNPLPAELQTEIEALARQYRFFHWHLAFPQIFDQGGFDCILGNPPWEKVNLKEQEWFAEKDPEIAGASNASVRKRLIAALKEQQPALAREFQDAVRQSEAESHVLRSSGSFPLCGRGDINLYAVFAEQMRNLVAERGLQGCIVQSDIATSETYQFFFTDLLAKGVLISFFDFVNTEGLFPAIHRTHPHFCLLTIAGKRRDLQARFSFWNTNPEQLADTKREFMLSDEDIRLLNPNTRTCPIFHSASDAELTKTVYRRIPIFLRSAGENDWDVEVGRMFHSSDDSGLFIAADHAAASEVLFLYESKCFSQFDHRFVTFEKEYRDLTADEKNDPSFATTTKNAVQRSAIPKKFTAKLSRWLLAYRRITNTTNERTLICSALPESGLIDSGNLIYAKSAGDAVSLLSTFNSFVLDFLCRQSMGGTNLHLYILEQLPVLPPATYAQPCPWANDPKSEIPNPPSLRDWLLPRVLELTYTAWDLEAFAADCGWSGPPFRWDEERRFLLRCELDAAFVHLYLGPQSEWQQQPEALTRPFPTPRHAVSYIMDTFPIVKRKDEAKHGHYRTKETILQIYDALSAAIQSGQPYQTMLNPPPAAPECRHPKKKVGILAFGSLIGDLGPEIVPRIAMRIKCQTPFGVEYGRYSGKTRGGAPTLVPHEKGGPVNAEILVLDDSVSNDEARDMLWRRETRNEGSGKPYPAGEGENAVIAVALTGTPCVETLFYTDFNPSGKIPNPTAADLAKAAIASAATAPEGKDGVTYLLNNIAEGIQTPLTKDYEEQILLQTGCISLISALRAQKSEASKSTP